MPLLDTTLICAPPAAPAFGGVVRGADAELGDGVQRDVEARIGLLRLLLHAAGVDAVESEVAVVERVADESDAALRAVTVIDGSRREQHQAGPVAAADGNLLDLRRLDRRLRPPRWCDSEPPQWQSLPRFPTCRRPQVARRSVRVSPYCRST